MKTRQLGKDGPQVSAICFGGLPFSGTFGAIAREQAHATVREAIDVGITFIDTAESYKASQELIGEAISGRRDEVFLATKVSGRDGYSEDTIRRAIENSLEALQTDHVDLYQLHRPVPEYPIEETMGQLLRLRDEGKIRYVGISNFSAEQTVEAAKHGPVQSSQPLYSMLFRDAEEDILPCCLENGIGVITHSTLGKGLLTGRYRPGHQFAPDDYRRERLHFQGESFERTCAVTRRLEQWAADQGRDLVQLAIAWVLAHPAVTAAIVGAKTPEQIRHSSRAADWELTEQDLEEIDAILGDLRLRGPFRQETA